MKIPKYAEQLNSVSTELDEWLEKNGIIIDMNQIKSEAIKEFANRLKEKCYEDFQEVYGMLSPYVTAYDIDNLVKEMTEV